MRIAGSGAGAVGGSVAPTALGGSASALFASAESTSLERQLGAYRELSSRWRQAKGAEREALSLVLSDSPFGRRALSVLNAFTRAAWPGAQAVPPTGEERALQAFDSLSETDREILAAMQADQTGRPAFASAAQYRAYLHDRLTQAQPRRGDEVSLSAEAQSRLAGAPAAAPPRTEWPPAAANVAAALGAYAKAGAIEPR